MTSQPSLQEYQPIRIKPRPEPLDIKRGDHRRVRWWLWMVLLALALYFFLPFRANILILGTDYRPGRDEISRTDTMELLTVTPFYAGMLGIPRDLWVTIPGVGENRINTAYFFAELNERGTGPEDAMETVQQTFGVTVSNYVLVDMWGFIGVVDALGGVDITLSKPIGGLEVGKHHLDGTQALAFARERYSGDDFSRMTQGQVVLGAMLAKMANPRNIWRLPGMLIATLRSVETDVPVVLWPRLGFGLARAAIFGLDNRTITREMVVPFATIDGAQVLAPDWRFINPVLMDMFGE